MSIVQITDLHVVAEEGVRYSPSALAAVLPERFNFTASTLSIR